MLSIFRSRIGSSLGRMCLSWPVLLYVYAIYLFCALTIPDIGKMAAGLLLLMGLVGLRHVKEHFREFTIAEKWLLASYALFSLVSILSFLYWPQTREARMHLEDYITFMLLLPLYPLLRQRGLRLNWLLVVLSLMAIVLGCVSVAQFVAMKFFDTSILTTGKVFWLRPSGDVNPMRYGAISLVVMAFSLSAMLMLRGKGFWLKLLLAVAVFFALVACLLTQVRGTWFAIPALMLIYAIYLYRAGHSRILIVLLLGGGGGLIGASQTQVLQGRAHLIVANIEAYQQGDSHTSIGSRLDMFKAAGLLIEQKPIFGHGLNSYSPKATQIRKSTPGMSSQVGVWANPHNEILQVMVEKGVIGLISLLLLFAAPGYLFLQALRGGDDSVVGQQVRFYAMSGLSLLIVYAVVGQSVALFEHDVFNHFFALMVLLFASQIGVAQSVKDRV